MLTFRRIDNDMGMVVEGNLMRDFDEDCCIANKFICMKNGQFAMTSFSQSRYVCMKIEICASCDLEV